MKFVQAAAAILVASLFCQPALAQRNRRDQPDMKVTAEQRLQVIDGLVKEVNENYVFPEMAAKIETSLRAQQKSGAYDAITSAEKLSDTLTRDIRAVTNDKHLAVLYSAEPMPERKRDAAPTPEQRAEFENMMRVRNYGVDRVERLPGNIGYVQLSAFAKAADAANALAAAMTLVSNTNALIIDLRTNGGGDPAAVTLLASYLFDERTHMTDIYSRRENRTDQMWSSDAVQGPRYGQKKDVYVLTSKRTFSAGEDFTYALQSLKRVKVVGETTGGGAHPGGVMRITPHFAAFVPTGRSISPITKTNWEGVGVTPDVKVSADEALRTAQLDILGKLVATEKDPGEAARLKERMEKVRTEVVASVMPAPKQ